MRLAELDFTRAAGIGGKVGNALAACFGIHRKAEATGGKRRSIPLPCDSRKIAIDEIELRLHQAGAIGIGEHQAAVQRAAVPATRQIVQPQFLALIGGIGGEVRNRAEYARPHLLRGKLDADIHPAERRQAELVPVESTCFRISHRPVNAFRQPIEIHLVDSQFARRLEARRLAVNGQRAGHIVVGKQPLHARKYDSVRVQRGIRLEFDRQASAHLRNTDAVHDEIRIDVGAFER